MGKIPLDPPALLVKRSSVPTRSSPSDYREELRWDFWYSCAYCTITEIETSGVSRFEVEHYNPAVSGETNINEYENLNYSCSTCNGHKGKFPVGYSLPSDCYILSPDRHDIQEHLEIDGNDHSFLHGRTRTGEFNEKFLYLNRLHLREIREIRQELSEAREYLAHGVRALMNISLDAFKPAIRGQVHRLREGEKRRAAKEEEYYRSLAKSWLTMTDSNKANLTADRRKFLERMKALVPSLQSASGVRSNPKKRRRRGQQGTRKR
jgi:hypothetical protein